MRAWNIFIAMIIFSLSLCAEEVTSMRRCVLLPITDGLEGAVGSKVYEEVENYLRESNWCFYRTNSDLMNLLSKYRSNLEAHLTNPEVLSAIADKTKSGSLIKVRLSNEVKGVDAEIKIYSADGRDLYFKEKTRLDQVDVKLVAQAIINWLEVYSKTIPYDGKVSGVLGEQVSMDAGTALGVRKGDLVRVIHPLKKRKHPLLQEIVDWETETLAKGSVFYVDEKQSQIQISEYQSKRKMNLGDWVVVDRTGITEEPQINSAELKEHEYGKLGQVGVYLHPAQGEAVMGSTATTKTVSGYLIGVDLNGELWITRDIFLRTELSRKFGSYKTTQGTMTSSSTKMAYASYEGFVGYRYFPLQFFYGPRVEGVIGYGSYDFGVDSSVADGLVASNIKGFLLGFKGDIPIVKDIRLFAGLNFMLKGKYTEDFVVYGTPDSVTQYKLEFGGDYEYSLNTVWETAVQIESAKAKFKSPNQENSFKETGIRTGVIYKF